LLIQAGIDINRQSESGTALHQAALCGKTEVVRLLLDSALEKPDNCCDDNLVTFPITATTTTLTSLNIKTGDIITVLEQHSDGRWKGCIHDNRTGNDRVGYFPSSMVEVISKRPGSRSSEASPHGSPTLGQQGGASEDVWVLRKPLAGGDP
ncbi:caskin-1-like, partial [Coregonus clupeaformis]|uniref:caskin-1-like n=1 Tax=Coregonus clupeaformis TaxID=59861 RepID=UPI001E1C85FF